MRPTGPPGIVADMPRAAAVARRLLGLHPPLTSVAVAMAGLCVVSLGGLLFDDREVLGQPIWTKTFRFTVSVAVYTVTLAWMLSPAQAPFVVGCGPDIR